MSCLSNDQPAHIAAPPHPRPAKERQLNPLALQQGLCSCSFLCVFSIFGFFKYSPRSPGDFAIQEQTLMLYDNLAITMSCSYCTSIPVPCRALQPSARITSCWQSAFPSLQVWLSSEQVNVLRKQREPDSLLGKGLYPLKRTSNFPHSHLSIPPSPVCALSSAVLHPDKPRHHPKGYFSRSGSAGWPRCSSGTAPAPRTRTGCGSPSPLCPPL